MKRALLILLLLTACSNDGLLSNDFKTDIDQILPIIKEANEEQVDFTDKESDLIERFNSKYSPGQYRVEDDHYYEMNDLEKAIYHEIRRMWIFAIEPESIRERATLASEKDSRPNFFKEAEETLDELMEIKSLNRLPEEFKDAYHTYEVFNGIYPEQFEQDANELLELYDPIVNGSQVDVNEKEWHLLLDFINQYKGDAEYSTYDYEQDGKHYLVNSFMQRIIDVFYDLKTDIEGGTLMSETISDFNYMKEDMEMFGSE